MNKNKTHDYAGMDFRILKVLDCRAFWKRYTSQWNWWFILSLLLWRAGMVGNPVSYELGVIWSPFSVLLLTFSRFCDFICWLHLKCVPLNENHASRGCLSRNGQGEKSGSSHSLTLFLFLKRSSKFTASAESSPPQPPLISISCTMVYVWAGLDLSWQCCGLGQMYLHILVPTFGAHTELRRCFCSEIFFLIIAYIWKQLFVRWIIWGVYHAWFGFWFQQCFLHVRKF